jgi:hypothetical protein
MYSLLRFSLLAFGLTVSVLAGSVPLTVPPLSGSLGQPIELFNGKDFTGWVWFQRPPRPGTDTPIVGRDEIFSIQDGILRSKGKPTGYLRTEREFTNFILTVEQRHVTAGNGGLLVAIPAQDKVWPGLEIQTKTGNAGELWNHNLLKLSADPAYIDPANPKHILRGAADSQKPVGEWETMEVIVDSGNLVFKVNGVVQSIVTNTESFAGRVGLQAEGAEMEFRKVRLTPIEPAK